MILNIVLSSAAHENEKYYYSRIIMEFIQSMKNPVDLKAIIPLCHSVDLVSILGQDEFHF
jgi:hypothetical protein